MTSSLDVGRSKKCSEQQLLLQETKKEKQEETKLIFNEVDTVSTGRQLEHCADNCSI
jgi:hypothetical protein